MAEQKSCLILVDTTTPGAEPFEPVYFDSNSEVTKNLYQFKPIFFEAGTYACVYASCYLSGEQNRYELHVKKWITDRAGVQRYTRVPYIFSYAEGGSGVIGTKVAQIIYKHVDMPTSTVHSGSGLHSNERSSERMLMYAVSPTVFDPNDPPEDLKFRPWK